MTRIDAGGWEPSSRGAHHAHRSPGHGHGGAGTGFAAGRDRSRRRDGRHATPPTRRRPPGWRRSRSGRPPARSPTPPPTARSSSTQPVVRVLDALRLAGAENLAGKVLIDVANPMKPDSGFPPQLDPVGDDSLAEQIQREFPAARVVKTLNTMNCDVMADPSIVPGEHDVFMAGRGRLGEGGRARAAARLRLAGLLDPRRRGHHGRPRAGDVPHLLDRPADEPRAQRASTFAWSPDSHFVDSCAPDTPSKWCVGVHTRAVGRGPALRLQHTARGGRLTGWCHARR